MMSAGTHLMPSTGSQGCTNCQSQSEGLESMKQKISSGRWAPSLSGDPGSASWLARAPQWEGWPTQGQPDRGAMLLQGGPQSGFWGQWMSPEPDVTVGILGCFSEGPLHFFLPLSLSQFFISSQSFPKLFPFLFSLSLSIFSLFLYLLPPHLSSPSHSSPFSLVYSHFFHFLCFSISYVLTSFSSSSSYSSCLFLFFLLLLSPFPFIIQA